MTNQATTVQVPTISNGQHHPVVGRSVLTIWLIAALAFGLRMWGAQFGLPHLYHPDEHLFVEPAVRVITEGDLNPHWFGHPGSTLMYLLAMIYGVIFLGGKLIGIFPNVEVFTALLKSNPTVFYLAGRTVTALAGTASVVLVYHITLRIFDRRTGLVAALFLAVSALHSTHSQLIRTDILATFFILSAFLYCLRILQKEEGRAYILAGLLIGGAVATKYTAVLAIIPLIAAHLLREGWILFRRNEKTPVWLRVAAAAISAGALIAAMLILLRGPQVSRFFTGILSPDGALDGLNTQRLGSVLRLSALVFGFLMVLIVTCAFVRPLRAVVVNLVTAKYFVVGLVCVLAGFALCAPYFFLDMKTALRDVVVESRSTHLGAVGQGMTRNALWYVTFVLRRGLSIQIELLAGVGFLLLLFWRKKAHILLLSFPVIFFLFISRGNLRWDRWIIPILPFVAILAAAALSTLTGWICRYKSVRLRTDVVTGILALLLSLGPIWTIAKHDYYFSQTDTRTLCKEWFEATVPGGVKIAQDWYTGSISEDVYQITKAFTISDRPVAYYKAAGVEYILVSSWLYNRYRREKETYPDNHAFYETLAREEELAMEFLQDPVYRPGPTIRVYRIAPDSTSIRQEMK